MASVNKAIVVGNLGRDPETRYLPNGDCVCNVAVATTESWKDKQTGEKRELTEWHRVTFYRKLAEIADQYLTKGSQVYIEGRLQTRKWTDKDGIERYTTEIIADRMQMLGSPRSAQHDDDEQEDFEQHAPPQRANGAGQRTERAAPPTRAAAGARPARPAPDFSDMDDDIPF